jgi:hypothetical protein
MSGLEGDGGASDTSELRARAQAWLLGDSDPQTQAELRALLDAESVDELSERMHSDLEFGTAGLRGIVGAGSARMNLAVSSA